MSSGSHWNKWDLHVHTPDSLFHNYPGAYEEAWEAFIADLEALPAEYKVIGVNDYLFVDGYERLLAEKNNGRMANIELLLPVIELRLDKFVGTEAKLQRVNLHVIFDCIDPDVIRHHFIHGLIRHLAIDPKYRDQAAEWRAVPTREALEQLGHLIIESVPEEEKDKFGPPLIEGFNNLNISFEQIKEVLESHFLSKQHILAVGKTEWADLKWNDHSIAEKKNLINSTDCVFTAAASPGDYDRARESLKNQNVNDRLLDCSDAHWLSSSSDKDRIGNSFTWIKGEPTFLGLKQALLEFEKRVFIGDIPAKLQHLATNPSRYIKSVAIRPDDEADGGEWFDFQLNLNPGLVAVVGNKGSGKSALLDTLGLLGHSSNQPHFSFLNNKKFLHPRRNLASKFKGTLEWCSEETSEKNLSESIDGSVVERVRYLPQQYIEKLCNELKGISGGAFDLELRNIVFSHVSEADRLGLEDIEDLLGFLTRTQEGELNQVREDIFEINKRIINLEETASPGREIQLDLEKRRIEAEIQAHEALKPEEVAKPGAGDEEEEKLATELEQATTGLTNLQAELVRLKNEQVELTRKVAIAKEVIGRIGSAGSLVRDIQQDITAELMEIELGDSVDKIISLNLDVSLIESKLAEYRAELERVTGALNSQEPDGLVVRQAGLAEIISELKIRLAEPQRKFVAYQEALRQWDAVLATKIGSAEEQGTLEYVNNKLRLIQLVPEQLEVARVERFELVARAYDKIVNIVGVYRNLYQPISVFLAEFNEGSDSIPITFAAEIVETNLSHQLWDLVNRQVRGSFSGLGESELRLRNLIQECDFNSKDEVLNFVSNLDDQFHHDAREGFNNALVSPESQIRQGKTLEELYNLIYGLPYLKASYLLKFGEKPLDQLSPGERGLLLLIFYLLVDKSDIPLIVDQPEENLDNQTIYETLVRAVSEAVKRRQVIVATHSANVAVVCDADQIVRAKRDSENDAVTYDSGSIEDPPINAVVVDVLEGTKPAFVNRRQKYFD